MRIICTCLLAVIVGGCALSRASSPEPVAGRPLFDEILTRLEHATFLKWASEDADRTLAWVYGGGDRQRPLDALEIHLAQQCPAIVKLAVEDLQGKIDALRVLHAELEADRESLAVADNPYLIYRSTRLRWGAGGFSILTRFRGVVADVVRRMDAVADGCRNVLGVEDLVVVAAQLNRFAGEAGP